MTLDSPAIVLALLVLGIAVLWLAVTPAGRRVAATTVDVIDASVAMFAIRRALGRDTTTARQRRIARRRAREQAEIERRIGVVAGASDIPPAVPAAPTRLIVSGDSSPTVAAERDRRRTFVRDGAVVAIGLVVVLVAAAGILRQPSGEVLGVIATPGAAAAGDPGAPSTLAAAPPAGSPSPASASIPPTATPTATSQAAIAPPSGPSTAPVVVDPTARLVGASGGGRTVPIRLAWDLAPDSPAALAFDIYLRMDDGPDKRIASPDGDARSFRSTVGVGRTATFRVVPVGLDGTLGEEVTWTPITPTRHQETSGSVVRRGTWRSASGPSLSGGGVTYSQQRGATLRFRFTGTDVGWLATRTPMSGRAQVRIDGDLVETIDLDAGDVRYRRLAFHRHVGDTAAAHTIEIRPIGDGRVDVDAFVVLR